MQSVLVIFIFVVVKFLSVVESSSVVVQNFICGGYIFKCGGKTLSVLVKISFVISVFLSLAAKVSSVVVDISSTKTKSIGGTNALS